ncbi:MULTISPECIES: DNA gyrase subunit A [unclassified Methylophaga]|jgi:DNA gyrase subunit A|uniref:DNA gyrase subunit A n=1 Tax=unclassified Methylophaga TaxID=2629249 RepID=UPI000C97196A|nr:MULTISPECIES: DNA gyrase subunit A [unclassified Methylophaga]MAK67677.1 DNA gyrase subunit A [Methylophaga sp.]MAY18911.1 DNA gyrase subunit A [Methylophaga sp.]MBN47737.1 DNA gyrase subunit A [Methylophaga sp.]|tara:strand:+ start:815 stop:3400 length:2586 start_codon:yes stop_codon:yes gene_type:complete
MSEIALELDSISIEDEMKQSYLDYAMSVIVGRALPDVRDGLKPVHRRVLYAMRELGNSWNSPYKKSARIVGDVIGKYHPHGDTAVYDTMVRMAQPFSMRYMLVDGQGNFGSVDGDPPAAMRYTEVRMAKIAHEMLADLDKETVDFIPNYDESESEPAVLPTRFPALLVNGSSGIAVGMATNIPPHNLTEILNACIAIIDEPGVTTRELMQYVPGPDFPTAGIINGANGIAEAYETGRGRVYMRARAEIETNEATGQQSIIVHELPYQVNKARLLEKIAELVKEKKIEGISALRDESDKDGMRMVVVIKRGDVPEVILNNLYQQTQLQTVFGINMVAIVDGQPRTLGLKPILEAFIRHRREVVTRRSIYELRKARDRAHILEGLATALANIDEVIELIKASPSPSEAREALLSQGWRSEMILEMLGAAGAQASRPEDLAAEFGLVDGQYYLSPVQAQAILDMRLHRLTGLEQDKILQEYREVLDQIRDLLAILSDPDNLMAVIRQELVAINEEYGDNRRTEILDTHLDLTLEDLITEEEMVVTLSHAGYAKTQQLDTYQAQRRGGKGKAATSMKDEDFIEHLFIANTHDTLLCFSSAGKVYWKKVYELPQGGRTARGKPIVNLLPLDEGERINAVLPIREFEADKFIFMATASGTVKKTPLVDYSRPRANGIIAVDLKDDDRLVGVALTGGESDVMLFSSNGKVIRFPETDVRSMGRVSRGVRGMRLADGEQIISLIIAQQEGAILTATEFGYGKRTNLEEYRVQGRGGQGIISIQTSARNGQVVGAVQVCEEDQIMLITNGGTLVRTPVKHVSLVGRNTQGVRLINLSNDEKLVGLERVIEDEDEDLDLDDLPHTDDLTEE